MIAPLSREQALQVIANPDAWASRPSLIALARMIAASALGHTITQRRREAGRSPQAHTRPTLRVIEAARDGEILPFSNVASGEATRALADSLRLLLQEIDLGESETQLLGAVERYLEENE